MMQNNNAIAANEGTALRELSLDETELVGGGFSWGRLLRGAEHLGSDVEHGMVEGAIIGGVGGGLAGGPPGAASGALLGSIGGAAQGVLNFLSI
jgi:hypothetical protein